MLKRQGLLAVGTARVNRLAGCQFMDDKLLQKKGRGSYDIRVDIEHDILACKWYDNKPVCLASSYVGAEPTDTVTRWSSAQKEKLPVTRPAIVKEYNSSMGGVDLHDMLVELYRVDIRVKRYHLRIVFHLIDVCGKRLAFVSKALETAVRSWKAYVSAYI